MSERFCLRCDWTGETEEPACPRCGGSYVSAWLERFAEGRSVQIMVVGD